MAQKYKQRRRITRTRTAGPIPQKWPETMEELNALVPSNPSSASVKPFLPVTPYNSATQRSRSGFTQFSNPDPKPGPTPYLDEASTTSVNYKPSMVEIGAAAAQQIMAKRNKELQEWGRLAAIAPALGLPVPPAPNWSGKPSSGLQQDQQATQPANNTMGINTDELAALALDQVGIHEELIVDENGEPIRDAKGRLQGNNKNMYGESYGLNGVYWCAQFVNWCANYLGIPYDLIPNKKNVKDEGINCASTGAYKTWYDNHNRYQKNDYKTPPHVGDIVILNNAQHIGIVVAYDPKTETVYTVEGNSRQYVSLNDYKLSDAYMVGFCLNGSTSYGKIPAASSSGLGATIT